MPTSSESRMLAMCEATKLFTCSFFSFVRTLKIFARSLGEGFFISMRYAARRLSVGASPSWKAFRSAERSCINRERFALINWLVDDTVKLFWEYIR